MTKKIKQKNNLQLRPPVVAILGHVDHGKTSILDVIRKSKIAEGESGGITQHIGAYQAEHQGKKITFIDTPGHETFSAMRSRGAKVADIAILVIACDAGIKPQTKEAIKHIKQANIPMIVALNKIDKKEAQPEKVKGELMKYEVAVESMGGDIPSVNMSAKTGKGIDDLLEIITLVAEMEELKTDPDKPAEGTIIELNCDNKRGITATLLVKEGTLKSRDIIGTDSAYGRVKTMEDFQLNDIKSALAGTPIIVTGFNQPPCIGEKFKVFENTKKAEAKINPKKSESPQVLDIEDNQKVLNIILKTDVCGCMEAVKQSLQNIPSNDEVVLRILKADVGDIAESDVKLAQSAKAKIVGFRVKASPSIRHLAQQKKVKITTFDVIYELIQGVRDFLSKLLAPKIIRVPLGKLKVLALFRKEKDRQIIGGKVTSGQAKKGALVDVIRDDKKIAQGKAIKVQRDKKELDEVNRDQECGVLFKGPVVIEEKDILEFYEEKRETRQI